MDWRTRYRGGVPSPVAAYRAPGLLPVAATIVGIAHFAVGVLSRSGLGDILSTQDDLVVGDSLGAASRLAAGSYGQWLAVDPGTHHVAWRSSHTYTSAATGDGTDQSAVIQAEINTIAAAGGGKLSFRPGTYLVLGVVLKSGVHLVAGRGVKFTKNGGAAGTFAFQTLATTSTATALTADGTLNAASVAVTSATGLAVDQIVLVRDATYKYSTTGRNQELNRITAITGTTITLANKLIAAYATGSAAELVVVDGVYRDAALVGLRVEVPSGTAGGPISLDLAYNVAVLDVETKGANDRSAIRIRQSASIRVVGGADYDGQNVTTSGSAYSVSAGESSHNIVIAHRHVENMRELPITDNARDVLVHGCTVVSSRSGSINTHGNGCERVQIVNNRILRAASHALSIGQNPNNAADVDVLVMGNHIDACAADGILVDASAARPNLGVLVIGNHITRNGVGAGTWASIWYRNTNRGAVQSNIVASSYASTNTYCLYLDTVVDVLVSANKLDGTGGASYGIWWQGTTDQLTITANRISNCSSYNLRSSGGATTNVVVRGNFSDDTAFQKGAGEVWEGNHWGAKHDRDGGVASVANAGTITHACVATPVKYGATSTVAGHNVRVTAVAATTLTVSLTDETGTAIAVAENVAWWAEAF